MTMETPPEKNDLPQSEETPRDGDESPLDELDDVVRTADDTGMVAQQQLLAREAERLPE